MILFICDLSCALTLDLRGRKVRAPPRATPLKGGWGLAPSSVYESVPPFFLQGQSLHPLHDSRGGPRCEQ